MHINEIRKQLKFQTEFTQLIEMLKNVAGQQYHLLEKEKRRFDVFMDSFTEFFRVVNLVGVDDPLVNPQVDVLGILMVTSDSGLMGGLNNAVIEQSLALAQGRSPEQTRFVVVGVKGAQRISDEKLAFKGFPGVDQTTIFEQAEEVGRYLVHEVVEGRIGRVVCVFPRSHSFTRQSIETLRLLPCADLFERESAEHQAPEDDSPEHGNEVMRLKVLREARSVVVESSYRDIVEYLVEVWISSRMFEIFEDSKLSEFSARAIHLEGSHQKLQDEQKKLKHEAFRAAHELVDKGMREGFSAQITKKKRNHAARLKDERARMREAAGKEAPPAPDGET